MLKNWNITRVIMRKTPAKQLQHAVPEPVMLYTDIEQLPAMIFVDCTVKGNLELLIISGYPSPDELNVAWLKLQSQYYELIKSPEAKNYISLVSKIEKLFTKINICQKIADTLKWEHSEVLINELKEWGFKYEFSKETMTNDLHMVISETRNEMVRLKQLQVQYERNNNSESEKPSKEGFQRVIFDINQSEKTTYKLSELTTYEFGVLYNRLREYIAYLKSQSHGSGR